MLEGWKQRTRNTCTFESLIDIVELFLQYRRSAVNMPSIFCLHKVFWSSHLMCFLPPLSHYVCHMFPCLFFSSFETELHVRESVESLIYAELIMQSFQLSGANGSLTHILQCFFLFPATSSSTFWE